MSIPEVCSDDKAHIWDMPGAPVSEIHCLTCNIVVPFNEGTYDRLKADMKFHPLSAAFEDFVEANRKATGGLT